MTSLDRAAALLEHAWLHVAARIPAAVRATSIAAGDHPRVLVIAPHPDDETAGAAGAILLHRKAGHEVTIACATDGGASQALHLPPAETAAARRAEAEAAAKILDANLEWLGLPERHWSIDQLVPRLLPLLANADLVYAPSRIDAHPEHFNVAHALAHAIERTVTNAKVRAYAIYVPLTPLLTNIALDVSSELNAIERALAAHGSQAHSIQRTLRLRRYAARIHHATTHAETFWELEAATYASLHEAPPSTWNDRYFGARLRSFRDPLAYLVGLRARRALASAT